MTIDQLNVYLALGLKVFPCRSRPETLSDGKVRKEKTPLTRHGFQDASNDPDQIAKWHAQYPDCAWAIATSAEYAIVDLDVKSGGLLTWARLTAKYGDIPLCPSVETGSGGRHFMMKFPPGTRNSEGRIGPGVDVRADGGYALIPPTRIHDPEGRHTQPYRCVVSPWECAIPDAPDWLVALQEVKPKPTPKPKAEGEGEKVECDTPFMVVSGGDCLQTHPGSPEGQRRVTFLRLVGAALGATSDPEAVEPKAMVWAGRCNPPFEEAPKHWNGLLAKELAKREEREAERLMVGVNNTSLPPATIEVPCTGKEGTISPSGTGQLVPSFTNIADSGEGMSVVVQTSAEEEPAPNALSPDAYHGLLGDILRAVETETEAHPAAVLVALLALVGNAVGQGAWVRVGPRRHHPALYAAICSRTAGGKGDAYAVARYVLGKADPIYCGQAIAQGVGSGEGLIERVRDELTTLDKKGNPVTIPAALDKRCLLRLSELSRAFRVGRRDSSTLSEMLREAWDGEPIMVPNRGGNALTATGYSVGVVGDITPGALGKLLASGTESVDGYANRFLWVMTERVRLLPFGGDVSKVDAFTPKLSSVLTWARGVGEVRIGDDAVATWVKAYPDLLASADTVPHTDRARPYALRLALVYALANGERVIGERHLRAALAVWDYCRRSAATLFGKGTPPEPDPLWLTLHNAIHQTHGISRSELLRATRQSADEVSKALELLKGKGMIAPGYSQSPNGGPQRECWYPAQAMGESRTDTTSPRPISFIVQAE